MTLKYKTMKNDFPLYLLVFFFFFVLAGLCLKDNSVPPGIGIAILLIGGAIQLH